MEKVTDCLRVLGLEEGASWDAINQSYRDFIRVWHPDRFQHDPRLKKKAEEQTRTLNLAIETLRKDYQPAPSSSKASTKTRTKRNKSPDAEHKKATPKGSTHTFNAQSFTDQNFALSPVDVYQRNLTSIFYLLGSGASIYLTLLFIELWSTDALRISFGFVLCLFTCNVFIRNLCILTLRRPLIRVDSSGIKTVDNGFLTWNELDKVWSYRDSSRSPTLAIKLSESFFAHQPIHRQARLRLSNFLYDAHYTFAFKSLNLNPSSFVQAVKAHHLLGILSLPNNEISTPPPVPWGQLIAFVCVGTVLLRSFLGFEMSPFEVILYLSVYSATRFFDIARRLIMIPRGLG